MARSARGAYWVPPNASHVLCWNWSPPKKPFPVLMFQSPPLSHSATASQVSTDAALAELAPISGMASPAPLAVTLSEARETALGL